MRIAVHDTFKPKGLQRKEFGKLCSIDGCDNPITPFKGPGSDCLCRDHQLKQVEYGGTGKLARPHTFHRKWVCDDCGKDVYDEVSRKFPGMEESDPDRFNRLCRNRIIGDHQHRKSDGGADTEENIRTLCLDCNSDKTILNEDYRPGNKSAKAA